MVMFTRKVRRKLGGNFTFLVLTDRDDLDSQIYKTFAGCGVADHDRDPCRASSGDHLGRLLAEHKSHVFSLIQKFNQDVDPETGYTRRDDVIVISDEAHRTQYGTLALNMRNALPNASCIGFTGTPLFKRDEITRQVFGDYVSTYDFQRAVEDGATVPLYYDARGDDLGVAIEDLNERIAEKLEKELETDDIDAAQRLERELKRAYHVITAEQRLDQVARDFVRHYSAAWETGKAMLVCIDKVTCVRMHALIERYWNERIEELEAEHAKAPGEQEAIYLQRRVAWMRETRAAVVVSEEQGEVEKFRRWDLDIVPHRRIIKEGMELPAEMRAKPRFRNLQRMAVDDAFKEQEHPFRIAVVCAMWLTGFDVPSLSTLYLDKPLKAHTLMQAIARANRVNEGKNNGLIGDYCGVLEHLRQALATFAGTRSGGGGVGGGGIDPARPDEELLADLAEAIAMVRRFLKDGGAPLDDVIRKEGFARNAAIVACKEVANENDETRKRFEVLCREVFKKFKACINVRGVNAHRADRDAIDVVYRSLQRDREQADVSDIIRVLHEVVDDAIDVKAGRVAEDRPTYDVSAIDFDRLKREFEGSRSRRTAVQALKHTVEQRLRRLLARNPLRTDFQQHYEELVAEYNREKDRVTIERTFEELLKFVRKLEEGGEPRRPGGPGRGVAGGLRPAEEAGPGQGRRPAHQDRLEGAAADAQGREAPRRSVARQGVDAKRRPRRHSRLPLQRRDRSAGRRLLRRGRDDYHRGRVRARLPRLPDRAVAVLRRRRRGLNAPSRPHRRAACTWLLARPGRTRYEPRATGSERLHRHVADRHVRQQPHAVDHVVGRQRIDRHLPAVDRVVVLVREEHAADPLERGRPPEAEPVVEVVAELLDAPGLRVEPEGVGVVRVVARAGGERHPHAVQVAAVPAVEAPVLEVDVAPLQRVGQQGEEDAGVGERGGAPLALGVQLDLLAAAPLGDAVVVEAHAPLRPVAAGGVGHDELEIAPVAGGLDVEAPRQRRDGHRHPASSRRGRRRGRRWTAPRWRAGSDRVRRLLRRPPRRRRRRRAIRRRRSVRAWRLPSV